jgi:hypothetical protein
MVTPPAIRPIGQPPRHLIRFKQRNQSSLPFGLLISSCILTIIALPLQLSLHPQTLLPHSSHLLSLYRLSMPRASPLAAQRETSHVVRLVIEGVGDSRWGVQECGYVFIVRHFKGCAACGRFPVDKRWVAG